jgi:predicted dehydrogenase
VLVRTAASVISAGTERGLVDVAKKSLLGKARERPDLVRKVFAKAKREGVWATLEAVRSKLDTPIPLGYSCAGTIEEVGSDVACFQRGDRVACAGAGYANHAQLNAVPAHLAIRIPDEVTFEQAAFATVTSVALQGIRLAAPTLGESVAVIGLGLLGQLAVPMLRANGCRVIGIDITPDKVARARQRGAEAGSVRGTDDTVVDVLRFTGGRGVDAVIVTAGAPTNDPLIAAGEICRERGRVAIVGGVPLEFPRRDYWEKELSIFVSRSYGPGRYDRGYEELGVDYPLGYVRWTETRNLEAVLDLVARKLLPLDDLITHRFPIGDAIAAYQMLTGPEGHRAMGILLDYTGEPVAEPVPIKRSVARRQIGDRRIGLGVIGTGAFSTSHLLPTFVAQPDVRPLAVCSARGFTARHAGQKFGFERIARSADEILDDPAIHAVVIATRHDSHAALAARALRAGKHVFLEKPLAIDETGLEDVIAAARESEGILFVGHNRRHAALSTRLKRFVAGEGPIQMLYRVNAGQLPPGSWMVDASGGGRIVGEGSHFVDLMSYLCGSLPRSVVTRGLAPGQIEAAFDGRDNFTASIQFANGSIGTLVYSSMGDPSCPKERLEVFAGGKMAILDDFRSLETSAGGKHHRERLLKQDKGHAAEIATFIENVRRGSAEVELDVLAAVSRCTFAMRRGIASERVEPIEPPCLPVASSIG